jgi:hypothetical protein
MQLCDPQGPGPSGLGLTLLHHSSRPGQDHSNSGSPAPLHDYNIPAFYNPSIYTAGEMQVYDQGEANLTHPDYSAHPGQTPSSIPFITSDRTSTEGNKEQRTSAPRDAAQANADDSWADITTATGIYVEYLNDFFAKQFSNNIRKQYRMTIESFERLFKRKFQGNNTRELTWSIHLTTRR